MHTKLRPLLASFLLSTCICTSSGITQETVVGWQEWNAQTLALAKEQRKPILLNLHAVWCHWCHVMDRDTYHAPQVADLVNHRFVAITADEGTRPDLAALFQDYGWPATIIFDPDGNPLLKRAGYIRKDEMVALLQKALSKSIPVDSAGVSDDKSEQKQPHNWNKWRQKLQTQLVNGYDEKSVGWGSNHKYLDADTLEFALRNGQSSGMLKRMALATLNAGLALRDPAWGGFYQYSAGGTWKHPHYEQLLEVQAQNTRAYLLAYSLTHDARYLAAAKQIQSFVFRFLTSTDGAFYSSMDADINAATPGSKYFSLNAQERVKLGLPPVDKHVFASKNGLEISALVALYKATGQPEYLQRALRAANWCISKLSRGDGSFRHDTASPGGMFLIDTLELARGFLALYTATNEKQWLARAQQSCLFIASNFRALHGYAASIRKDQSDLPPAVDIDQNVALSRFANELYKYSRNQKVKATAETALAFLHLPSTANSAGMYTGGILLADHELRIGGGKT